MLAHSSKMWGSQQVTGPGKAREPGCSFPGTALQSESSGPPAFPALSSWTSGLHCGRKALLAPSCSSSFILHRCFPINLLHI